MGAHHRAPHDDPHGAAKEGRDQLDDPGRRARRSLPPRRPARRHRGARFWRATDTVLARSVAVHALDESDPRVDAMLEGARVSATVTDPHLLRVLDADIRDGMAWVINEWGTGHSLDEMVSGGRVLPPDRAAWLVREVAAGDRGGPPAGHRARPAGARERDGHRVRHGPADRVRDRRPAAQQRPAQRQLPGRRRRRPGPVRPGRAAVRRAGRPLAGRVHLRRTGSPA